MSKVWVTQETKYDFTAANLWGDVEFITTDEISPLKASMRNDEIIHRVRAAVNRMQPDDYVVPTGSPYVAALVFCAMGLRGIRQLRMLRWSSRDQKYIPIELELRSDR